MVFLSYRDGGNCGVQSGSCHTGALSRSGAHKGAIVAQEVIVFNSPQLRVHEFMYATLKDKGKEPAVVVRSTVLL